MRFAGPRTAAALLAPLLLLAAAVPAGAAQRGVPAGFFGSNWDGAAALASPQAMQETQFRTMATAGVETVRTSFLWALAQPSPGGPFDLTASDRLVAMASAHGASVLPVVILAPDWARQRANAPFSPPRDAREYARYLTVLVERYGPSGSFWSEHPELPRRPIRAWQIWNEPHLGFQWTLEPGQDYAPGYTRLLRAAYAAVKAADPAAQVVLAGLANSSPSYLAHLYRAGIHGYFDVAAIHPYTRSPGGVLALVRRFRAVMHRNHDGSRPLWVTELGLPASRGRAHSRSDLQTTPLGMASFLSHSYGALAGARRFGALRVDRAYWYTWASGYSGDIFRYSGLFRYPGGDSVFPQPAYRSYVRSARSWEGCAKSATGACR